VSALLLAVFLVVVYDRQQQQNIIGGSPAQLQAVDGDLVTVLGENNDVLLATEHTNANTTTASMHSVETSITAGRYTVLLHQPLAKLVPACSTW
jgi:hypothetical protein